MKILVIADDFTGAAEIAAAGVRFGLSARVANCLSGADGADLIAINTNSRLLSADRAVQAVEQAIGIGDTSPFNLIYKKTDSVLRGPVAAEVEAVARLTGRRGTMLCPQNPSKGRTIVDGVYRINGVPIAQTQFARDPDFPATSSKAFDLLNRDGRAGRQICEQRLIVGEGDDATRLLHWAAQAAHDLLPAGGVDFFEAVVSHRGRRSLRTDWLALQRGRTVMVCGSACDSSRAFVRKIEPAALCRTPNTWAASAAESLARCDFAAIAFPESIDASLVERLPIALMQIENIEQLLIEGGSTAASVFTRFGWEQFDVLGELSSGVAVLRPIGGPIVAVKPGSYPWPDSVLEGV